MNMMIKNIKQLAKENTNFRSVIATGPHSQIVLMCIPVGGEIGEEVHPDTDQILVFVKGNGMALLNGEKQNVEKHDVVLVPAGVRHNFTNTGDQDLKLYTVYAPPHHKEGTIHKTKQDADEAEKKQQ
jgi:mannose-6-phosphate isomerase-like protein (cupin superfamily)